MSKKEFKPLPPIEPVSALAVIAELKKREYSDSSAWSYAKAARSWTEKDSPAWKVWKQVEAFYAEKQVT